MQIQTAADDAEGSALLPSKRTNKRRALAASLLVAALVLAVVVSTSRRAHGPAAEPLASTLQEEPGKHIGVWLGNGCFWERQWAYYNVETKLLGRLPADVTAQVGYAGGSGEESTVCYHCGWNCPHSYETLGHAEVVRVLLDAPNATAQFEALARDFFDSFRGPDKNRHRPDPMDVGPPYRSVVGIPGGVDSPLFFAFNAANQHGMDIKIGTGEGTDEANTVWLADSERFPFFLGEAYHQFHSNFFASEGMPYPPSYTVELYRLKISRGELPYTGCPEGDHW